MLSEKCPHCGEGKLRGDKAVPILESEMPFEVMTKRAKTHKCGECGGMLTVCWGGAHGYNEHVLRCGENFDHDTLTDYQKPSKEYEEGNKLFRRLQGMDTTALMKMDKNTMLERIGQAKFPQDLTEEDKLLLAEVSISYGLDPVMQELMIYQGNPYPTINARYRKAQETGKFDGINTRPASAEEFEARHCKEGDILYCAEVWVKGCSHPFIGWGRVRSAEAKGNQHLPIVKDPDRQAEKRAEAMGLRKGFSMPIPFQSWEEFEEQRAEGVTDVKGIGKVDDETGEIIESTARVLEDEPEAEPAPEPEDVQDEEIPKPEPALDESPASKEDIAELQKWMGKAAVDMSSLGQMIANELKWKMPKTLSGLKKWQVAKLIDIYRKYVEE